MDSNFDNEFFQLLNPDNTMSFNRLIAHAIGANETIIYFSLISKRMYYEAHNRLDENGFFYATSVDIQESTTFTKRQQIPAIKKLEALGLIETKLQGVPARKYYRIIGNQTLILRLIEQGKTIADSIRNQQKHSNVDDVPSSSDKMLQLEQTQENSQLRQNVTTRSNKMSQQAATKSNNKEQQNVAASSNKMSRKTKDNKLNKINLNNINLNGGNNNQSNQSIYQSTEDDVEKSDIAKIDKIDKIDELNRAREIIKSNIDYDFLILPEFKIGKERVDEIVELMAETVVFNKKPIYIGGSPYPPEVIKNRLLKLTKDEIEYVFSSLDNSRTDIKNIKAYLIAALYNSKNTIDNYYTAEYYRTPL